MLFDKRYFPSQKLVALLRQSAEKQGAPLQFSTMKTGATDGGRYNVMGGGGPWWRFVCRHGICTPTTV